MSRHRNITTVRKERIEQFRNYLCNQYFGRTLKYENAIMHHRSFIDTKWGTIIHDEAIALISLTTFIHRHHMRIRIVPYDMNWDE